MGTRTLAQPLAPATSSAREVLGVDVTRLKACLTLVKPRIVSLVVFTAVVACFAAARGRPSAATVLLLILTGSLSAGGAAGFNHYLDRDIDALMPRTRTRPLVTGQIRDSWRVLLAAWVMVLLGIGLATKVNLALAFFELTGAFVYAVVYTRWLKRRTPLNIVIGGLSGSVAVLGGWAAVDVTLGIVPVLLAALVFFWTPAHFWSLAMARGGDYARACVPMLPTVLGLGPASRLVALHIAATVALSIWVGVAERSGLVYFTLAIAAGAVFSRAGIKLWRQPTIEGGWQTFKLSGAYLGVIFLAVFLDSLVGASLG